MARTIRTPRPHRVVQFPAFEFVKVDSLVTHVVSIVDENGEPVLDSFTQEYGRRKGLHTHKSQTSYRRKLVNRRDRMAARAQLRKGRYDEVETRQPRGRAISLAS